MAWFCMGCNVAYPSQQVVQLVVHLLICMSTNLYVSVMPAVMLVYLLYVVLLIKKNISPLNVCGLSTYSCRKY